MSECVYHCPVCDRLREVTFNKYDHLVDVQNSGLVLYSDIHNCEGGLLGINNLHIDANFDVRSFSYLELPNIRVTKTKLPGLPSPESINPLNKYVITKLFPDRDSYRIILKDSSLNVLMNIGLVKDYKETPIATITSKTGSVILDYYECGITLRGINKKWFQIMVDSLENLPPTRLGLFLETLRFVFAHKNNEPGEFEVEQLKTILTTHETRFELIYKGPRYKKEKLIATKYGYEKRAEIKSILDYLESSPNATLRNLLIEFNHELVYQIYLLLILENEGVLNIIRDFE